MGATRDCKHGQLARSCEICGLETERDALAARVTELEAALEEAERLLAEAKAWCQKVSGMDEDCGDVYPDDRRHRCPDFGKCPFTKEG